MQDNNTLMRIKRLLEIKHWSIYRLAHCSNIPYSSLNNIFLRNTEPTLPTLRKICSGLGITLSEFFQDDIPASCYETKSKEEEDLLKLYQSLPREDKELLFAFANGLAKRLPSLNRLS